MKLQHIVMICLSIYACNIIITLLHELGHALVISKFCKGTINVYLGSYGNQKGNILLKTKRIYFYITKNIFKWKGGLCKPMENNFSLSFRQEFFYLIAGPITPVIFAVLFFYISKYYAGENFLIFSMILLITSIISMIYNLIPKKESILLSNGKYISNDGLALRKLFKFKKHYPELKTAYKLYSEKRFIEAGNIYSNIIEKGIKHRELYSMAIVCYSSDKNHYQKASEFVDTFLKNFKANSEDLINIGFYYSKINNHKKALDYFKQSLDKKVSWYAYNNIGACFNETEKFNEAIKYLDKAVNINPKHAYAYSNRGYTKLKLGRIQEAVEDLETSHKLDPENAYYFRNMGIYHFDNKQFAEALILFEKAKEKDPDTYKIDYYINECTSLLN